jgi:phosphate acyltransferase
VVKSHGGTDAAGFATSLRIALEMADSHFLSEIETNLSRLAALEVPADGGADQAQRESA